MEIIDLHEARTRLSELVDKVTKGEQFLIAKAGKPVACVTSIDTAAPAELRRLGFLAGEFTVPEDFDRMGQAAVADLLGG